MIIAEMPYETGDPTVDFADRAAQGLGRRHLRQHRDAEIRRAGDQEGRRARLEAAAHPQQRLGLGRRGAAARGLENAKDILTTSYLKDQTDPALANDPGVVKWRAFMDKYYPEGDKTNSSNVSGYVTAALLVQVLKQCGDNLTRENVMKQTANLKNFELDMLLPGIKVNTSPTDYFPLEELQMRRFSGERWESFGPIISGEIGS